MTKLSFRSISLISSPYHVGLPHVAVARGPAYLKQRGIIETLKRLGIPIKEKEVTSVEHEFEGDIARSFEVIRRTSKLVRQSYEDNSFPVVLAGNCSSSVGVVSGMRQATNLLGQEPACVWFDAHDDFNTPDTITSGYFDSMPVAMLGNLCFKSMLATVPDYAAMDLRRRLIHVGMRDVNEIERRHVEDEGLSVVWGSLSADKRVDFEGGLTTFLNEKKLAAQPTYVHFDVDSLDTSIGKANRFAAPGGLQEQDLLSCLNRVAATTTPMAITIASLDPGFEGVDKIADVAIRGVLSFLQQLKSKGIFTSEG